MTPLLALLLLACPGGRAERESGESDSGGDTACPTGDREYCGNAIDDDCDGLVDELENSFSGPLPLYDDADGDGYHSFLATGETCAADPAPQGDDCDDADPAVNPGAAETCDGIDNDCDGEGLPDCEWEGEVPLGPAVDAGFTTWSWVNLDLAAGLDVASGETMLAAVGSAIYTPEGDLPGAVLFQGPWEGMQADEDKRSTLYRTFTGPLPEWETHYTYPWTGAGLVEDLDGDGETDVLLSFPDLTDEESPGRQVGIQYGPLDADTYDLGYADAVLGEPEGTAGLGYSCAFSTTILGASSRSLVLSDTAGTAYVLPADARGEHEVESLVDAAVAWEGGSDGWSRVSIADLNGDGIDDLTLGTLPTAGGSAVGVWLGPLAAGTTSATSDWSLSSADGEYVYAARQNADMDGDGIIDLAVAVNYRDDLAIPYVGVVDGEAWAFNPDLRPDDIPTRLEAPAGAGLTSLVGVPASSVDAAVLAIGFLPPVSEADGNGGIWLLSPHLGATNDLRAVALAIIDATAGDAGQSLTITDGRVAALDTLSELDYHSAVLLLDSWGGW